MIAHPVPRGPITTPPFNRRTPLLNQMIFAHIFGWTRE